jgi:hypothetical protein
LASIFIFAPMVAWVFRWLPLDHQIITGLFLVAVMPSTLSSGVVMTGGAGGNAAHALLVTIIANALAVFTIPVVLSLLLATTGDNRLVVIDKAAIMIKIALLVLVPWPWAWPLNTSSAADRPLARPHPGHQPTADPGHRLDGHVPEPSRHPGRKPCHYFHQCGNPRISLGVGGPGSLLGQIHADRTWPAERALFSWAGRKHCPFQ